MPSRGPSGTPVAIRAYGLATGLLGPILRSRVRRRLAAAGVPPDRLAERDGHATLPRPAGRLVWLHAASVGESLSVLPLVDRLLTEAPDLSVLVTTGTATSATVLAPRLPPRARHQFAPLDRPAAVAAFLDHWRPDLGVMVESEIWPVTLRLAAARGVPLALVNARLSAKSLRNWSRAGAAARDLFGRFSLIAAQDARTRDGLAALGADPSRTLVTGDMKAAGPPPAADPVALSALQAALGGRPVWVAASTHAGEEDQVLDAQAALLAHLPTLLLILVPRHPDRAAGIRALVEARRLRVATRSTGALPGAATQVYLADTLGESGLWYRLSPLVFLAGSFGTAGGHNPWEAAALGAALLHGPNVANAAAAHAALDAAGGAAEVADGPALAGAVLRLLRDPDRLAAMRAAAAASAGDRAPGLVAGVAEPLLALLPPAPARPRLVAG